MMPLLTARLAYTALTTPMTSVSATRAAIAARLFIATPSAVTRFPVCLILRLIPFCADGESGSKSECRERDKRLALFAVLPPPGQE
jgi:hypothetical protein